MPAVLVDSNVLLDVTTQDPVWGEWSISTLERIGGESNLVKNALVYAEASVGFSSVEELEKAQPAEFYRREDLPYEAAFLAGKVFAEYRRRGGSRRSPLPDFYIGAQALLAGYRLLTRDARRFSTYFPDLELIAPAR